MMTKKVVVTGASGFIAQHCLPRLVDLGFEVHAIARHKVATGFLTSKQILKNAIIWHQLDLFERESTRCLIETVRPSHLLHCAWFAKPGIFWTSPENVNCLLATIELVRIFGEVGGKCALGLGTCAEYDWSQGGICSESQTPLLPMTIYGQCKLAAHQALLAISRLYGFNVIWGRLFFPYGPGEPPNKFVSSVIRSILQQQVIQCSDGRQIRDFLYVEDIADILVRMLDEEIVGAYNIGSGQPVSLRDIVSEITLKLGRQDLIQFGERPPHLNDPPVLIADVRNLYEKTAWQPRISLASGIGRLIEVLSTTNNVQI